MPDDVTRDAPAQTPIEHARECITTAYDALIDASASLALTPYPAPDIGRALQAIDQARLAVETVRAMNRALTRHRREGIRALVAMLPEVS